MPQIVDDIQKLRARPVTLESADALCVLMKTYQEVSTFPRAWTQPLWNCLMYYESRCSDSDLVKLQEARRNFKSLTKKQQNRTLACPVDQREKFAGIPDQKKKECYWFDYDFGDNFDSDDEYGYNNYDSECEEYGEYDSD